MAAGSRIKTKIEQLNELFEPPTFSGQRSDWKNWVGQFKEYIQASRGFSEGQKLTMLKRALNDTDRAKLSGDFYESFQLLVKSYDGVYVATMAIFDELYQTPSICADTSDALFELVLITNRFIREFRALGAAEGSWEPLRLSESTHLAWEDARMRNEMPMLSRLLNFLLERTEKMKQTEENLNQIRQDNIEQNQVVQRIAQETPVQEPINEHRNVQPMVPDTSSRVRRNEPEPMQNIQLNRTVCQHGITHITCYHCAGPHPMALCGAFKSLSLIARRNRVQELKLCRNCFSAAHRAESLSCKAHPCKICAGQLLKNRWHNTLLCDRRPAGVIGEGREVEGATSLAYQQQARR